MKRQLRRGRVVSACLNVQIGSTELLSKVSQFFVQALPPGMPTPTLPSCRTGQPEPVYVEACGKTPLCKIRVTSSPTRDDAKPFLQFIQLTATRLAWCRLGYVEIKSSRRLFNQSHLPNALPLRLHSRSLQCHCAPGRDNTPQRSALQVLLDQQFWFAGARIGPKELFAENLLQYSLRGVQTARVLLRGVGCQNRAPKYEAISCCRRLNTNPNSGLPKNYSPRSLRCAIGIPLNAP